MVESITLSAEWLYSEPQGSIYTSSGTAGTLVACTPWAGVLGGCTQGGSGGTQYIPVLVLVKRQAQPRASLTLVITEPGHQINNIILESSFHALGPETGKQ